jgi:type I restriction enzyme S subunit
MEVEEYTFRELLGRIVDNRGRTCPTAERGTALIATNCIKDDHLYPVFEKVRWVDSETMETWFRGHPEPGDILFVLKGSPGRCCLVPDPINFCVAQDMVALRADESKVSQKFLFALLRSSIVRNAIDNLHVGTMIPHFKKGDFEQLTFQIPKSRKIQDWIGEQYFILSDKIELNRRMNATLEGMAQALFKSWFVDFDPVIDNALAAGNPIPDELAPRAEVRKNTLANGTTQQGSLDHPTLSDLKSLFPAAFEFTDELGWIPEGWKVAKAEDLVTRHKVKQKFTKKNALEEGPVPIFDQGAGLLLGYSELPADQDSSKENPKFIFGDHTCITHLSPQPFSVGPNVIPLSAKTHAPYWTYYAVKDLQKFQEYRRHWMEFSIKETVLPSPELASVFDNQAKEFRALMESKEETSKTLVRLRDTLLPKLIGGDLRLSDAEPLTEEAMA